jgi:hypothetical protein
LKGIRPAVLWLQGPHSRHGHTRLPRAQRHEPFTPRLPHFVRAHPTLAALVLAAGGIFGNWFIARQMSTWPGWMLFPGMLLSVCALVTMILGLGLLVVRLLEPLIALMGIDWGGESLAVLGIPLPLQRKCEQLGYWTADDLVQAIERGKFNWVALEFDERLQVERAADRWRAAGPSTAKRSRWKSRSTRQDRAHG